MLLHYVERFLQGSLLLVVSPRRVFGLSLGVTVLFVIYILYWNRLLANLVCLCLRLSTWDKTAPGSFWISAGESGNPAMVADSDI
jgi:hypothetical protein